MDKKKKFQYLFFYFLFNFHILLMLKCFWKYLLKVRQVKNRQFRKQYARTQLEKKRRRWYNAESEIFSRKNNPLRQLYTNKMCTFKTPTVRSLSCTKKGISEAQKPGARWDAGARQDAKVQVLIFELQRSCLSYQLVTNVF